MGFFSGVCRLGLVFEFGLCVGGGGFSVVVFRFGIGGYCILCGGF